jgi:hypothetical protein
MFTNPDSRVDMMRGGWKSVGRVFILGMDHHGCDLSADCLSMVLPCRGPSGCRNPGSYTVSVDPRSRNPDREAKIGKRVECRG